MMLNLKSLSLQVFLKLPEWSPKTHKEFPLSLQQYFWNIYKLWYLRKSTILDQLIEKDIWIRVIKYIFEFEKNDKFKKLEKYHKKIEELWAT
jgi:hypothetical protein